INRLSQEVLSLLWVILRLQGIVHYVLWSNRYTIVGISFLMFLSASVINFSIFAFICFSNKNKVLFIFDGSIKYLLAILQTVITKTIRIVPRCSNSDH